MNKEEIEELKRLLFQDRLTQYGKRKLVKYLEQLEFKVKANEKEHEYDVEMIDNVKGEAVKLYKEINRLNAILDKVTDKLKEDIKKAKERIKYYEKQYKLAKEKEDKFYIKSFHRQINRWQSRFETLREILKIIEGEKE